jgi:hypothetical protein
MQVFWPLPLRKKSWQRPRYFYLFIYLFIYICVGCGQVGIEKKDKAAPVAGHQDSHFLNIWLTYGGQVVSLICQPPFAPRKIPGTHFCQRLSRPQGDSVAGGIRLIGKSIDLMGNRSRDVAASSIVPQPTTLPRASY